VKLPRHAISLLQVFVFCLWQAKAKTLNRLLFYTFFSVVPQGHDQLALVKIPWLFLCRFTTTTTTTTITTAAAALYYYPIQ
jgi:uncharacterized membrane protein